MYYCRETICSLNINYFPVTLSRLIERKPMVLYNINYNLKLFTSVQEQHYNILVEAMNIFKLSSLAQLNLPCRVVVLCSQGISLRMRLGTTRYQLYVYNECVHDHIELTLCTCVFVVVTCITQYLSGQHEVELTVHNAYSTTVTLTYANSLITTPFIQGAWLKRREWQKHVPILFLYYSCVFEWKPVIRLILNANRVVRRHTNKSLLYKTHIYLVSDIATRLQFHHLSYYNTFDFALQLLLAVTCLIHIRSIEDNESQFMKNIMIVNQGTLCTDTQVVDDCLGMLIF